MTFSTRIRQLRRERKMTLTALAEAAGISRSYLSELEHQRATEPSVTVIRALAEALGTSSAVLMNEDPEIAVPEIPESLRLAQEKFHIPERDMPALAAVKFRDYQPVTPEDWQYLYESIKRSMPRDVDFE